jgi:hypothetical protein
MYTYVYIGKQRVSTQLKMTATSSLEKPFVMFLRFTLAITPIWILEMAMKQFRTLLKFSARHEKKLLITEYSHNIDQIESYRTIENRRSQLNMEQERGEAIIYIHGGAFSLCDSSDILIAERLLPLLALGGNSASMYSILYNTSPQKIPSGTKMFICVLNCICTIAYMNRYKFIQTSDFNFASMYSVLYNTSSQKSPSGIIQSNGY